MKKMERICEAKALHFSYSVILGPSNIYIMGIIMNAKKKSYLVRKKTSTPITHIHT